MQNRKHVPDYASLPNSCSLARVEGHEWYFTGKPCSRGHIERRRANDGRCWACEKQHNAYARERHRRCGMAESGRWIKMHPDDEEALLAYADTLRVLYWSQLL